MRGMLVMGAAAAALVGMFAAPANAQDAEIAATAATSGRIAVGQSVTGALEAAGDSDWYQVSLRGNQGYRFTLRSADGDGALADPLLRLLDASGTEVSVNDDSGGTLNSRINFTAPADGVYYLDARAFSSEDSGAYVLTAIEYVQPTDSIPAGTGTTARLGATPVTDSINFDGDVDTWRVALAAGSIYTFTLNSAAENGLPDPYLRLLNAAGEEVASDDDGGGNLNSRIEFVPEASGAFFIEARNLSESGEGAYTISMERRALPADAVRGDLGTRARIAPGGEVAGVLDYPRDRDWYRVALQEGQTYRFSLDSAAPQGGGEQLGDPLLRVLDGRGEEVARDDDGGDGLNSYLEYTATRTGDFILEARGFSDIAEGGYRLRARTGDIPGDTTTDMTLSAESGDYREGLLSPAGDTDWYAIDLGQGQTIRVQLLNGGSNAVGDPLVTIRDASGAEVARDDDSGGELNSYLEYTPAAAGRYFIEARGFAEQAQGTYVLQVQPGEIGANRESAESINIQAPRMSQISAPDDVDWFSLTLIEGRSYRIYLDAGPDSQLDPYLTLLGSDSVEIASDDDGGMGVNAYLSFIAPSSNTYYAAVSAFNAGTTGQYVLRVMDTETPGSSVTDEMLQPDDDARAARIDFPGDKDWFAVDLAPGGSYEISATGSGTDPLSDPMLTVVRSEGGYEDHHGEGGEVSDTVVASDDNSGPGRNALVRITAEDGGTHFVQVNGKNRLLGDYTVSIRRTDETQAQ